MKNIINRLKNFDAKSNIQREVANKLIDALEKHDIYSIEYRSYELKAIRLLNRPEEVLEVEELLLELEDI